MRICPKTAPKPAKLPFSEAAILSVAIGLSLGLLQAIGWWLLAGLVAMLAALV